MPADGVPSLLAWPAWLSPFYHSKTEGSRHLIASTVEKLLPRCRADHQPVSTVPIAGENLLDKHLHDHWEPGLCRLYCILCTLNMQQAYPCGSCSVGHLPYGRRQTQGI